MGSLQSWLRRTNGELLAMQAWKRIKNSTDLGEFHED
jgi:hypothetical protein